MLKSTLKTSAILTPIECSLPLSSAVSPPLSFLREILDEVYEYYAAWWEHTRLHARQLAFYQRSRPTAWSLWIRRARPPTLVLT